jgi:hypothetical protein
MYDSNDLRLIKNSRRQTFRRWNGHPSQAFISVHNINTHSAPGAVLQGLKTSAREWLYGPAAARLVTLLGHCFHRSTSHLAARCLPRLRALHAFRVILTWCVMLV